MFLIRILFFFRKISPKKLGNNTLFKRKGKNKRKYENGLDFWALSPQPMFTNTVQ